MKVDFGGNSVWQLVAQSDLVTKFVLLILLSMSIICWAVFLYKVILLRIKRRQMTKALYKIREATSFEELRALVASIAETLPGYFLKKNLATLKSLIEAHADRPYLDDKEKELLYASMDQNMEDVLHTEESYLPILFTCASVAPLLGLFGTIWGLVHSFIRISEKQSADITTVAPGIAEALITTLAGLIVAIPALIMYHYLMTHIRDIEHQLYSLNDKFNWIVQRLFVLKEGSLFAPSVNKSSEVQTNV